LNSFGSDEPTDVGQTGIEVAQHKCGATAVQVCGLNPAG